MSSVIRSDSSNRGREASNSMEANNSRDISKSRDVRTVGAPAGHKQQQKLQGHQQAAGSLVTKVMPTTVHASNTVSMEQRDEAVKKKNSC
jgi:hypothetical protein